MRRLKRLLYLPPLKRPGAETGRQAWLRAMCPLGREGSTPSLGTTPLFISNRDP